MVMNVIMLYGAVLVLVLHTRAHARTHHARTYHAQTQSTPQRAYSKYLQTDRCAQGVALEVVEVHRRRAALVQEVHARQREHLAAADPPPCCECGSHTRPAARAHSADHVSHNVIEWRRRRLRLMITLHDIVREPRVLHLVTRRARGVRPPLVLAREHHRACRGRQRARRAQRGVDALRAHGARPAHAPRAAARVGACWGGGWRGARGADHRF